MNKHERWENDFLLAERLKREARRAQPEFSPKLHARIMAAVRVAPLPESAAALSIPAVRRKPHFARGMAIWTAVAASLAIAVTLAVAWHGARPAHDEAIAHDATDNTGIVEVVPPQAAQPTNAPGDLDSAADVVATTASGITDWVQSTAGDNQWAGLDRDAQAAIAAVSAPLPFDLTVSVASSEPSEQ
jgi:hypothetical protein